MWVDGSLHGRVARIGEIGDFYRDFLAGRVLASYGLAVDGVPENANLGNRVCILPDYVDCDKYRGVSCDTACLAKDFAGAQRERFVGRKYNIIYTRACAKKKPSRWGTAFSVSELTAKPS